MIANPTTLILGAGASAECGYPTGAQLREEILGCKELVRKDGRGQALQMVFRTSLVPSIDAFLAEEENAGFIEVGRELIARTLLPKESKCMINPPPWVSEVFNAIRGRNSELKHQLKVITFNYDLSLEHYLFGAFKRTYSLTDGAALEMLQKNIEIIHVYGTLGSLNWHPTPPYRGHIYGSPVTAQSVSEAAESIRIIGRDPNAPEFTRARRALDGAQFIGVLGFGYDLINCENLALSSYVPNRRFFSTGKGLYYGMRGYIRKRFGRMMIGSPRHGCSEFLRRSGLMRWANTPDATPSDLLREIEAAGEHAGAEFYY